MKVIKFSFVTLILGIILFIIFQSLYGVEKNLTNKSNQVNLKQQFHKNPDVYAWITVDGTKIDYPVAQHPNDDTYYLSHDLDGAETYYGAIFTERVNPKTFDDPVTIIYGHAITDESMFGSLDYFANQNFFKDHSKIQVDTFKNRYEYEVMAAHPYTDDHLFHHFQLGTTSGLNRYIQTLKKRVETYGGTYRRGAIDSEKDKILILSTCDAVNDEQRFVVTARLKTVTERKNE
ncbi:class B sortase [Streptococcus ovis]|uniref:class B sortase n=1 Tax=Streptococcus ovis TaxID=82806 RepID=UPI000366EC4C|nr:class B sortase [Streptococcus ovis]